MNYISIYIHIPYCLKKCLYCSFNSIEIKQDNYIFRDYVNALNEEIVGAGFSLRKITQPKGSGCQISPAVNSIFFGGGTPSILNPQEICSILNTLKRSFTFADKIEITLEANPETILCKDKLEGLKEEGVNRISLGVQTFDDHLLKVLGRVHNRDAVLKAAFNIKAAGFENFSIDLISGIPSQSISQWEDTIHKAISLSPSHISAYNLTLEEGTPLYYSYMNKEINIPDEDLQVDMYKRGEEILTACDYRHYEISNYAKKGRESRHNLNYWDHGEYLGFGAGAHSYYKGKRWWNIADPVSYIKAVEEGRGGVISGIEDITRKDAIREYIMLGLRKIDGIDIKDFKRRYQSDILSVYKNILNKLIEEDLIRIEGEMIRLSEKGILFHNQVASRFF